jgi:hypothetical protein
MKTGIIIDTPLNPVNAPVDVDYITKHGIQVRRRNGPNGPEDYFNVADVDALVLDRISKFPAKTGGIVQAAKDARGVIDELMQGLGSDMDKFDVTTKAHIESIRLTRFAMVTEVAHMIAPLKDIRQFFLASDYKEQIERLREFVDLCERLEKLKKNGTLDRIADTMLSLAITPA